MNGNKIRRIAVTTSGGDAPGMNAAIRSVVRAANDCAHKAGREDKGSASYGFPQSDMDEKEKAESIS